MGYQRIDLLHVYGLRRLLRWRSGRLNGHDERHIMYGQMPAGDDRFWADHTGRPGNAYVFDTEREAAEAVQRWLADGRTWEPVPAVFDSRGEPCDGKSWRVSGQRWFLIEDESPAAPC